MSRTPQSPERTPGYDAETDTYRTYFGPTTAPPSATLLSAVAALTGTPRAELPPLYDAIDPEALDHLFGLSRGGSPDTCLSFTYADHRITVRATGLITIDSSLESE